MKKLLILPLLLLLVTGCKSTLETSDKDDWIYFYTDEETCAEDIIYDDGYSGGMTPRLNKDGVIMLNEECLNEKGE